MIYLFAQKQMRSARMNNIIFIGMPAAGKSTIGVVAAKRLGYEFIDTDILIQKREKRLFDIKKQKHLISALLSLPLFSYIWRS